MADPAAQTMRLNAALERVEAVLIRIDERLARLEAQCTPANPPAVEGSSQPARTKKAKMGAAQ
jgi:hypothetical protein